MTRPGYPYRYRCTICDDTGTILWTQTTDDQRTVLIAYRCDCAAGENRPGIPPQPAHPRH